MRSTRYSIPLPNDYDMSRIEERARSKAPSFLAVPGLRFKAFLAASVAHGATRNMYAPFYVWDESRALSEFLTGALFASVIDSFGRPAVHDHQVLEFGLSDPDVVPHLATFETLYADRFAQPAEIWRWERWAQSRVLDRSGLFGACSTLDPVSWMVTRVRLWAGDEAVWGVGPDVERFRVLAIAGQVVGPQTQSAAAELGEELVDGHPAA